MCFIGIEWLWDQAGQKPQSTKNIQQLEHTAYKDESIYYVGLHREEGISPSTFNSTRSWEESRVQGDEQALTNIPWQT